MAVNMTFNSILNEIQFSKLNFAINLTPFAAYITLKKSSQVDKQGTPFVPSPPLYTILQQSNHELSAAQAKIVELVTSLGKSEQKCSELESINATLLQKVQALDKNLVVSNDLNNNLMDMISEKDSRVMKLETATKDLENQLKLQKKEYVGYVKEAENQLKTNMKTIKIREK